MNGNPPGGPEISVIILNYNGQQWLSRCLESLERQTIFDRIEVIVVDNQSPDGSAEIAAEWARRFSNGRLIQTGANLYFCGGNNRGAEA
ncbi:MAG TPA: glycosyltransferase, partial [Desulfuromonadaceae bacterium]|nr:glycosyltransferase [Desulfuromonadaceae bacterium]